MDDVDGPPISDHVDAISCQEPEDKGRGVDEKTCEEGGAQGKGHPPPEGKIAWRSLVRDRPLADLASCQYGQPWTLAQTSSAGCRLTLPVGPPGGPSWISSAVAVGGLGA